MKLMPFAVRDLAVAIAVVAGWVFGWRLTIGEGWMADLLGVVLGLGVGVVAFLAHEWGHLLGAIATGGSYGLPPALSSPFLFSFDSKRNSQRQFLLMSLAGFVVTAVSLAVVFGALPPEALATRVGRGMVLLEASLTLLLEVPLLLFSLMSGSILRQAEVFPIDEGADLPMQ